MIYPPADEPLDNAERDMDRLTIKLFYEEREDHKIGTLKELLEDLEND